MFFVWFSLICEMLWCFYNNWSKLVQLIWYLHLFNKLINSWCFLFAVNLFITSLWGFYLCPLWSWSALFTFQWSFRRLFIASKLLPSPPNIIGKNNWSLDYLTTSCAEHSRIKKSFSVSLSVCSWLRIFFIYF